MVDWVGASNQAMHGILTKGSNTVMISFEYAKCTTLERRSFWEELESITVNGVPWIITGDFKIIRNDFVRKSAESQAPWRTNCENLDK